ncbi:SIMPL domain-containing protein [Rufibacter glacialis]|uniref:SIMPL domain-containing protein n=1 Tax=Rufibacter glacialis TaxID=1259555 RepID=A0A5M8QE43_9BACT|nr:SIMPL domain-containing protein [Rufibacter glacialis]KAA6433190.1 SIMPL domain-containing protein [Rufibacter glacialis]GGK76638.1 SIMPL domain-containing protein [Rufibacter glacialis]
MKQIFAYLIVAVALVVSVLIAASAYKYKFKATESISVTGSAEVDFTSNLVVWTGYYARRSMDLKNAYAALKQDEGLIRQYLRSKGIQDSSVVISSVEIMKDFQPRFDLQGRQIGQDFTGYNLTQQVKVESTDIGRVERLSREVTELIEKGVEFNSTPPQYYYTKLKDLKHSLLAKASEDGRLRAKAIAENSGGDLGSLRKATMGVFQIVGQNSNENYSYGGVFNTSDKDKTATITVRVEYAVD